MKELTFREKLDNKIKESIEAKNILYKNKEENKQKIKQKMIEKIEESTLLSVYSYSSEKERTLYGPIFFVTMLDKDYYIEDYYGKEMVLFQSIDEIESFIKEIMKELDPDFDYEMRVDENGIIHKASIRFKYEYKEREE